MNAGSLLIALPIFFLVYQGVGLWLDSRENRKWGTAKKTSTGSANEAFREFTSLGSKLAFNKLFLRSKSFRERLELLLLRSGYPFGWKAEDFLFCKEIIALILAGLIWRFAGFQPVLLLLGLGLGFWLPDVYMKSRGTARQGEIRRQLPGFVDLTALALESGLDLMAAIDRIVDKMRATSLREELHTLMQENRLGTPRKEALQNLAYRVNIPDLQALTSIIIQSEELGTGLSAVLRNYSEDMRSRRILGAEEMAGKAPVKLLFPMMVFFFPIVFVIIFGPLALSFMAPK